MEETIATISIAELARRFGCTRSAIRGWEVDQTFPPPRRDRYGARAYTDADVAALRERLRTLRIPREGKRLIVEPGPAKEGGPPR